MTSLPIIDLKPGKLCSSCGDCCKTLPGGYLPEDFGKLPLSKRKIKSIFNNKDIALDWYEGDPRVSPPKEDCKGRGFFFRPRTTNHPHKDSPVDPSWGGTCIHYNDDVGCTLKRHSMPSACKALKPKTSIDDECIYTQDRYTKRGIAIEWLPYYDIIEELNVVQFSTK